MPPRCLQMLYRCFQRPPDASRCLRGSYLASEAFFRNPLSTSPTRPCPVLRRLPARHRPAAQMPSRCLPNFLKYASIRVLTWLAKLSSGIQRPHLRPGCIQSSGASPAALRRLPARHRPAAQMPPRCLQMLYRCFQRLPRCFHMLPDASRCSPDAPR